MNAKHLRATATNGIRKMRTLISVTTWAFLALATLAANSPAACNYSLSPTNRNHGYTGSSNTVTLNVEIDCPWTILNTNSWITFLTPTNGTGPFTNGYSVAANPTYAPRVGYVTIGGQPFSVTQAGIPCTYSLSPSTRTHGYGTANNSITVQTSTNCYWGISNTNAWIVFTGATNGYGTNAIPYMVLQNQTPVQRTGNIVIADQVFVMIQHAAPCLYELSPTNRTHGYAGSTGYVTVATSSTCIWSIDNTNTWITITANPSGQGNGAFGYNVAANPNNTARTGTFYVWDQAFTVFQNPTPCSNSYILPTSYSPTADPNTNVIAVNAVGGCAWDVVNSNSWITITPTNGFGPSSATCIVAANINPVGRTGVVMIAGQNLTVKQDGGTCTTSLSPTNRNHGYGAATNTVTITTLSVCPWNVVNTNTWVTFSPPTNGAGNATLTYSIPQNSGSLDRTGTVVIGGQPFLITQRSLGCAINLSPANRNHGNGAASNSLTVNIGSSCNWSVINTNPWISIVLNSNGIGSNVVGYTVSQNPTAFARSGYITVEEGATFISQNPSPCTYSLTPSSFNHSAAQETGTVSVASLVGCNWNVSNTNAWITILSATNGTANGTVIYRVDTNLNASARVGMFTVEGQTYTVNQAGVICSYKLSPTTRTHGYAAITNTASVTVSNPCPWFATTTNSWIAIVSGASGAGTGVVTYALSANASSPADRIGGIAVDGQFLTITQHGIACAYSLTPTTRTHGYGAASNSFDVTTASGCPWGVGNTNTWITLTSVSNGTASDTVGYTITDNTNMTDRIGVLTVDGQTFTITQRAAVCVFDLTPTTRSHGYGATTGSISVATTAGCGWLATTGDSWITILSGLSGTGTGTVTYALSANTNFVSRNGSILIGDQNFAIDQAAYLCSYKLSPTNRNHGFGANTNTVNVIAGSSCAWTATTANNWIAITSGGSGAGNGTITYTVQANFGSTTRTGAIAVADQVLTLTQSPATDGLSFEMFDRAPNGQVTLRLAGGPSGIWELQTTTNLINWTKVADLTNTTGRVECVLPPSGSEARFYRAVLP
jgi:hypothetical protein